MSKTTKKTEDEVRVSEPRVASISPEDLKVLKAADHELANLHELEFSFSKPVIAARVEALESDYYETGNPKTMEDAARVRASQELYSRMDNNYRAMAKTRRQRLIGPEVRDIIFRLIKTGYSCARKRMVEVEEKEVAEAASLGTPRTPGALFNALARRVLQYENLQSIDRVGKEPKLNLTQLPSKDIVLWLAGIGIGTEKI